MIVLIQLQTSYGVEKDKRAAVPDDLPDMAKLNFKRANTPRLKELLKEANLTDIVNSATTTSEAKEKLITKFVECAITTGLPYKNYDQSKTPKELKKLFNKCMTLLKKMRSKMHYGYHTQWQEQLDAINADILRTPNPSAFYKYAK